jgi:ABC-2 type transport system permease protein
VTAQAIAPILIAVVIVALMVMRVRQRSAGGSGLRPRRTGGLRARSGDSEALLTPSAANPPALRLLPLPGDIGLVAARELRIRVRGRVFKTGTLLILVIISAAIVIPALLGSKASIQKVGVAGPLSAPVRAAVVADGPAAGTQVELVAEPGPQAPSPALRAARIDGAIVDGRQVIDARAATAAGASTAAQLAAAVARTVGTDAALQAARLSPAQAAVIARARPLPVSSLQPGGQSTTQRNTTVIGLLLLTFMLTQYNAWTLTGVLEEKSSRIVEVLLATVTPARLLAGKVLGIGLTVFVQVGLTAVVAACEARATHSDALAGVTPEAVASILTWLVLGYAFYSWLYAAAGSTVDRQEQVQPLLLPLALPVIFGYFMATTTVTSGNPSVFFHVLAYLPPTAPFAMPTLVSLGAVSWWQFALSAAISVACTVGVARLATAVYRASVLRTGSRVPLRELLTR